MSADGSCAVVIPTWRGEAFLPPLLAALRAQGRAPSRIIVADTASGDRGPELARAAGCEVLSVAPAEFNHGGTRNAAAALALEDFLVFLTQDAMPADAGFLGRLLAPFADPAVGAAYARQVPHDGATPPEVFARGRNYPATASRRTRADLPRLGVRGLFFSNVASAVRRSVFIEAGGFPADVIMNEDMVLCARVLDRGLAVAYAADAVARHSHDYSIAQQFRRYFDIGVFFAQQRELLRGISAGGEGMRFALAQLAWLLRRGHPLWAARAPFEIAAKWLAFRCGRSYRRLPKRLVPRLSLHRSFWMGPCAGEDARARSAAHGGA
jgi:rhamnosyltransferase